jgi:D-alanine-D-alanine ligase
MVGLHRTLPGIKEINRKMQNSSRKSNPSIPPGKNGNRNQPKSLGPIDNLEAHVPADWWRWIFNAAYLKTDGDVVADEAITAYEVSTLVDIIQPQSDWRMLDLCCGQGRHTLEFARRGFQGIEGLDRSHYLIQKARKQARSENLSVRFREGDARKLPHPADRFDAVLILGNSFGYFETIDDDLRVLREVLRVLKPEGVLVLDLADGDYLRTTFKPRSWEWAGKKLFVCRERALSSDGERLISREIITHSGRGVIADQFYAERLYTQQSIQQLALRAGFRDPVLHPAFNPASTRNQDLGMMAQRMLITCSADKALPLDDAYTQTTLRNIAVVMGDPRKNDFVKPTAVFDADDFYTIEQLQQTLASLSSRNFTYYDNHDQLIEDLTRNRDQIDMVFNLCDEGYYNDPRKELHVPALMEILGINYTGGGPQCLAFCYDKSLVRGVASEMGIPVPEAALIKSEDSTLEMAVPFPVIVKPNFGDSSFGIVQASVVDTPEKMLDAVAKIRKRFGYEKPVLVEEFLPGQDLSVGILGNPPEDYTVLPIIEEDYSGLPEGMPRICGYEAKWLPDSPYWNLSSIPAEIPDDARSLIVDACVKLFVRLECRDYCRFDWRLDAGGNPKLLEANPNPGWCWDGHLAKMASLSQMSYAELLEAILHAAETRIASAGLASDSNKARAGERTGLQKVS